MLAHQYYRLFPRVMLQAEEESAYLLDFNQGQFYGLDSIGYEMLSLILKADLETTLIHCAQIYDVPLARLQADLEQLLTELISQQLLIPLDANHPPKSSLPNYLTTWGLKFCQAIAKGGRKLFNPGADPNSLTINCLLLLSWLSFRYLNWGTNLELWQKWHPQAMQTNLDPEQTQEILTKVDRLIRANAAGSFFFPMVCKERALVGYHLLRVFYRLPVQLVIGTALYPLQVHAWVEYQGQIITDDPEHCAYFDPIMTYPDHVSFQS